MMILKRHDANLSWLIALFLLVLIPLLVGCNSAVNGTSASNTSTPKLDSSPKGPGAGSLTATARATPVSTVCPTIRAKPASTSGWKIYMDTTFSFQFSVPPDWRAGSFNDGGNDYIAQVFPPGSTTPFGIATADPEHFQVSVLLAGTASDPAHDPNWRPEATPITISGTKTTLYDRTSPACEEVNRIAVADFGQRHYTFFMTSVPCKAKNDLALFLGMLQSFAYTG